MKLILASTSKFKNEILDKVGMKHSNIKSNFIETSTNKNDVYQYVKDLSYGKAKSVEKVVNECIILGLDTVVYADGKILEKPTNIEEAKNNLKQSAGKTTSVITGITLINTMNNQVIQDYQETKITLSDISDEDIEYYIKNEPGIMYASGFIIETIVSNFIKKIDGSFYNMLGAPVEKIYEHLLEWNIHLKDLEK